MGERTFSGHSADKGMEPAIFTGLFKDLLNHLYDYPVLESHPLTTLVEPGPDVHISRGEYLRQLIGEEIQRMQPGEMKEAAGSVEWRPYYILQKRYVEGQPLKQVAAFLAIGDRQLRRDHNRALEALASRVWERLFGEPAEARLRDQSAAKSVLAFDIHLELVDLVVLLEGVQTVLAKRLEAEELRLSLEAGDQPVVLYSDRIVLRQVFISLINVAMQVCAGQEIKLKVTEAADGLAVAVSCPVDDGWEDELPADLLESARYWAKRVDAQIKSRLPAAGSAGEVILSAALPASRKPVVLVVDDQEPSVRLYQRFASRTNFQVVGTNDPAQALSLAHTLRPALITLDVMMPHTDGWEVLQSLQQDPETKGIPVVVCSAWEEPELARSLGAAAFFKKPITQKDFLALLEKYAGDQDRSLGGGLEAGRV